MRAHALPLAGLAILVCLLAAAAVPASAHSGIANVTVYATPDADFDDATDIETAIDRGTLEPGRYVLNDSTIVVAIRSERLAGEIEAHDGTPTRSLFDALEDGVFSFVQENPTAERDPRFVRLGPRNATAYRSGHTTYVVLDPSAFTYYRPWEGGPKEVGHRNGDRYVLAVGLHHASGPPAGSLYDFPEAALYDTRNFSHSEPIYIFDRKAEFSADVNRPLATGTVRQDVRLFVPPENELRAVLTMSDGRTLVSEFVPSRPGHRGAWGGISGSVQFDLAGVDNGTDYTLLLVHDSEIADRSEGTVLELRATLRNVTVERRNDNLEIRLDARFSHGGSVVAVNEYGWQIARGTIPEGAESTNADRPVVLRPDSLLTGRLTVVATRDDPQVDEYYPNPESRFLVFPGNGTVRMAAPAPPRPDSPATPTPTPSAQPTRTKTDSARTTVSSTPGETGGLSPAVPIAALLLCAYLGLRRYG